MYTYIYKLEVEGVFLKCNSFKTGMIVHRLLEGWKEINWYFVHVVGKRLNELLLSVNQEYSLSRVSRVGMVFTGKYVLFTMSW